MIRAAAFAAALAACALVAACADSTGPRRPPTAPRSPIPSPAPDEPEAPSVPMPDRVPIPAPPPPDAPSTPAIPAPPAAPAPDAEPPTVHVVLGAFSKQPKAAVQIAGGWTLRSLAGAEISKGRSLRGDLTVDAAEARLPPLPLPYEGAEIVPDTPGDLRIGARRYPGRLRLSRTVAGRMRAQIDVDVETYLEGVVAGELPPDFPHEARRVQAVIARTYLLSQPNVAWTGTSIQVDDSGITDQEFVGIAGDARQQQAVRDAVASTRGIVLFDGAKPVRAWYHSTCGGHTASAAPVFKVPPTAPLGGVPCTTCTSSRYYRWSARIAGAKVVAAARLTGALQGFRVQDSDAAGRATSFEVKAGGKTVKVHAADFRLVLGPSELRSTWLDSAKVEGADLVVAGRGWGHGVGLCQVGARGLADRGATAESILATYYPGAAARRLW